MSRFARVGETIEGRWVVLGSEPRRDRVVVHIRDRRLSGCRLTWIPCPAGADRPRFRRQAQRWAALPPHPGLVACYGPRNLGDQLVAVVEHSPSPTLERLLEDRTISPERAYRWGFLLVDALRALHAQGLCHGAVDPDACRVDSAGDLRLGDLTLGSGRAAAPAYTPLEGGSAPAADVYGAAAILYRLLTGQEPFGPMERSRRSWLAHLAPDQEGWRRVSAWLGLGGRGRPEAALMEGLRQGPSDPVEAVRLVRLLQARHSARPPRSLDVAVEPRVEEALLAALDPDPAQRPTAEALAEVLSSVTHAPTPGPYALRASTLKALALDEAGEGEAARSILEAMVQDQPRAPHPWINLAVLQLREDPDHITEIPGPLEAYTRGMGPAGWDDAVGDFSLRIARRVLRLEGPIRGLVARPGGEVAVVGAFPTGARLWAAHESGGSRPIRGGLGAADEVHLLGDGSLLIRRSTQLIRVDRSGSWPLWTQTLRALPRGCAVGGGQIIAAVGGQLLYLNPVDGREQERVEETGVREVKVSEGGQVAWRGPSGVWLRVGGERQQVTEARMDHLAWAGERLVMATEGRLLALVEGELRPVAELPGVVDQLAADRTRLAVACGARVVVLELEGGAVCTERIAAGPVSALALDEDAVLFGDGSGWVRRASLQREEWPPAVPDPDSWTGGSAMQREVGEVTLLRQERGSGSGVLLGVLGARRDWSARYPSPVAAISFDADNTLLAVAEERAVHVSRIVGRTVHLDAQSLLCSAPVRGIAFSADGRELAAGLGEATRTETPSPGPIQAGARLMVREGDDVMFSVPVGPAGLTIGRSHDRDLVIPDTQVSRRHCTLSWVGGRCVVRDDGSANGFRVNDRRCWEAVLQDGDRIQLGGTTLTWTVSTDHTLITEPIPMERQVAPSRSDMPTLMVQATDLAALDEVPVGRADVAVVWRLAGGQAPSVLPGHRGAVRAVCFRSGGGLVSGGDDGILRIWQPGSAAAWAELRAPEEAGGITSVAVSWNDRWALVGYEDRCARLWDLDGRRMIRSFEAHRRAVTAVALSNDGRRAITGSADGTAQVWNCRTGARVANLLGHTGTLTAVGFSPDDRVVLTGSEDGRLCVWHRVSGELLEDVEVGADGITAVGFSPDGRQLATGGRDGTMQVWLVRWLWSFLDDVVRSAEALFQDEGAASLTWPAADRDLDFWLDVWGDLRRCASDEAAIPPELAARWVAIKARVRVEIARRVPTRHGGALGTSIGFGAAPQVTPDGAEPPFGPQVAVAQVDPDLAASLA